MSGQSSSISIPTVNVGDTPAAPFTILANGTIFETAPAAAANGEAKNFRVKSDGRMMVGTDPADPLSVTLGGGDFSTETTLAALLAAFNAEDFASETTLSALNANFLAEDFASETTLNNLLVAFNAEDFATETTLAALRTDFNAEDFATQTTLNALLTAFNAEDFAREVTLVGVNSKLTSLTNTIDLDSGAGVDAVLKIALMTDNSGGAVQFGKPDNPVSVSQETASARTVKSAQVNIPTAGTPVRITTDGAAVSSTRVLLSFRPNPDSVARYWYGPAGVAVGTGHEVFPGESVERINDAGEYYIVCDTNSQTVHIVEQE